MSKKWLIAVTGTVTHLLLGTVYAWSFFQTPITEFTGWNNAQAAWAFSLSIFMLGVTAAWAGNKMQVYGPRKLAMIGGALYALGYLISGFALANQSLILLYLGFGIIGGIGLGLAYVTPVATVSAWFTQKQGLATGMVVMGFGFGALVMSKFLAPIFLKISDGNLSAAFYYMGAIMIVLIPMLASFLQLPKNDRLQDVKQEKTSIVKYIKAKPFITVWLIFMINIVAGMIFISFQSPLLQDMLKVRMPNGTDFSNPEMIASLAASGATLIAVSSIFNGLGRFVWGSVSDKIGRMPTFRILLALQALIFVLLIFVSQPVVFSVLVCVVLLCYGGGFGVLPSLTKDMYGSKLMSSLYGALLTAWSVGGIIGPQIVAFMKDNYADKAGLYAFVVGGALLLVGLGISLLHHKKA
ncbi:MAG: OFA family MFS transporter [Bacteroidia bacterium]|nr:OFA family MFS transporter [Bacteroidia bacterium]